MLLPTPQAQDEALLALTYIRAAIDRTTRYSTFSALALFVIGAAALAGSGGCGAWSRWPGGSPQAGLGFLGVWTGVFLVAVGGLVLLTWLKARSRGEPAWTPILRTALTALLGPGLALALGTLGLFQSGQAQLLPGLWLLLYGCALYGVSFFAPLFIRAFGAAFMGLGLAAWLTDPGWAGLWLGLGFGGLHLVFGGIVVARYRG